MREFLLLRHAHAQHADIGQADFDRPLSPRGCHEAQAVGRWLAEHHLIPDRVLCSPARRARETLDIGMDVIGELEKQLEPQLYDASVGTLIQFIEQQQDAQRLLIVGHNPSLERVIVMLSRQTAADFVQMPPAGVALFTLPVRASVLSGVGQLKQFWSP